MSGVEHVSEQGAADESRPTGDEEHAVDYSRGDCITAKTVVEWNKSQVQGVLSRDFFTIKVDREVGRVSMKRFAFFLAGVLFLVLAGCGEVTTEQAVAGAQQTIEVASAVPTITPTLVPNEMLMVEKINAVLNDKKVVDDLSKAIDAHYQVMDIRFEPAGGTVFIFQMDVLCICVKNANCCVPERTFVVIAHAMEALGKPFVDYVPTTILETHVHCTNGSRLIGTVTVSWDALKNYILDSAGQIGGYQLGNSVHVQYP
jgi:hypothetical protein